jgi:hypothetical protein
MATATKAEATKTYTVLKNLRHDGKGYLPGKPVELTEAQADVLLKLKVVKLGAPTKNDAAK